jgi:hypothetical protein
MNDLRDILRPLLARRLSPAERRSLAAARRQLADEQERLASAAAAPSALDAAPAQAEPTVTPWKPDNPMEALDLAELVAEWVECYGHRWRAIKAAAQNDYGDALDLDELRRAFDLHPWRAYRAELRSLDDAALLVRCRSSARAHQRAVKRCDPRAGWYVARLEMAEEERRRRGSTWWQKNPEAAGSARPGPSGKPPPLILPSAWPPRPKSYPTVKGDSRRHVGMRSAATPAPGRLWERASDHR